MLYFVGIWLYFIFLIFRELDDELQDSLYDFLEARGINDELAEYLHQYMKNKDKTEYIRWMETLKSFVEKNPKN